MIRKNRIAFLTLEGDDFTPQQLLDLTGFARCADCGFAVHTPTLTPLPEHYCARRQPPQAAPQSTLPERTPAMASLISFATDAPVNVGDTLTLTSSGDWVELVSFRSPYDEEDPGSVTVRHPWGETCQYEPTAVGCHITT